MERKLNSTTTTTRVKFKGLYASHQITEQNYGSLQRFVTLLKFKSSGDFA
jgi:hypothetical protein